MQRDTFLQSARVVSIAMLLAAVLSITTNIAEATDVSKNQTRDAVVFLIAGDVNAEGQAPFSKETNTAAGHEANWPVMPGSTAADIGLPVKKEAYPNSFIWSLAKNAFSRPAFEVVERWAVNLTSSCTLRDLMAKRGRSNI